MAKSKKKKVKQKSSLVREVTGQQWAFCYEFVRTNDKYRALDAGYPHMKGRKVSLRRLLVGKILKSARISRLIEEMRLDIRQVQKITLEQHLSVLGDIRDRCLGEGKFSEALRAEELRGKASGFYVDRKLTMKVDLDPQQMRNRAQSLVESNPRLQELLGLKLNRLDQQPAVLETLPLGSSDQAEASSEAEG